jgi:ethanolamine utilization protein EutM
MKEKRNMTAIGLVESRGLTAALEAVDVMCKAAHVRLLDMKKIGSGLVVVMVEGDVAAVSAAVDAGRLAYQRTGGELIAAHVIPRPHPELSQMFDR